MRVYAFLLWLVWVPLATVCAQEQPQNCSYEVEVECDLGDRKKCADQACKHVRTEWHWYDANGDGVIDDDDDRYAVPIYKCEGRIGYYGGFSYYMIKTAASDNLPDGVDGSRLAKDAVPSTVFCWQKAGCPVEGCSEVTDLDDAQNTLWYCTEPEQTAVNDQESKKTQ
jgi:hypothetical protein